MKSLDHVCASLGLNLNISKKLQKRKIPLNSDSVEKEKKTKKYKKEESFIQKPEQFQEPPILKNVKKIETFQQQLNEDSKINITVNSPIETEKDFIKFESDLSISQEFPTEHKYFKFYGNHESIKVAPWIHKSTMHIKDSLQKLHNEIIDFYDYIKPSKQSNKLRELSIQSLRQLIQNNFPNALVQPFGSQETKLYLPDGDIDLVIIEPSISNSTLMQKVANIIARTKNYENLTMIRSAKVPLIKVEEKESGVQFDIAFNKCDGVRQIKEVKKAIKAYPELKYLMMLLKCFLKQRELHETYTGGKINYQKDLIFKGIGSFLLFCIVISFLRHYRQQILKDKSKNANNVLLSEYFLRMLEFYGINFDYQNYYITIHKGGGFKKKEDQNQSFSLISPQDESHDIGNAAFRIKEVFLAFKNRFNFLTCYNFKDGESILKYFLNPQMEQFSYSPQE